MKLSFGIRIIINKKHLDQNKKILQAEENPGTNFSTSKVVRSECGALITTPTLAKGGLRHDRSEVCGKVIEILQFFIFPLHFHFSFFHEVVVSEGIASFLITFHERYKKKENPISIWCFFLQKRINWFQR